MARVYHERQYLQHCLKHALNSLLGSPVYDTQQLDHLCDQQRELGARRTWLLGNYDANVLSAALEQQGLDMRWHDARRGPVSLDELLDPRLHGVILNVGSRSLWAQLTGGRHWVTLRRVEGAWYNLDSHLPAPQRLESTGAAVELLSTQQEAGAHIILILQRVGGGGPTEPGHADASPLAERALSGEGHAAGQASSPQPSALCDE